MSARSEQDSNLGWVKSELDETLTLARQALEVYVENPNDEAQLRFVTTHLHQVVGTLQIVELYGAALLAEEAELVVNDLIKGNIKIPEDAYEVIMRAILQLPVYLDHIQQGYKDNPVSLLPLMNDLRTTRGQQLLSEHAFFSPNLDIFPNKRTTTKSNAGKLPQFAKKLRPLYQTGLVGLFRNTDVRNNLKLIATVIRQLENSVDSQKASQLLWICGGVIEGLYNQGLEANVSLKSLLGQVDRLIKKLIDEGEEALSNDIPKELLKNLLYYVAQTKPKGHRVNELKEAFNLKNLLPNTDGSQKENEIAGLGADVIKNVSKAIKEDMLSIKESLDLFVRSEDACVADLEPLCQKLCAVADTLGLLGMGKLRKLIKEQEQVVSAVIKDNSDLDDSVIMGIASALLFVESSVNDLRLASINEDDDTEDNSKLLPDAEYNQLVELTITEAKSVLARVKDAFIAFAADTSKSELLEDTPNLIREIKGAFVIVSFGRAADLINSCGIYITQKLLESKSIPDKDELDALADVISGIEYFLENFAHDSSGARKSLDITQKSLVKLGFPPENIEPVADDTEQKAYEKIDLDSLKKDSSLDETVDAPTNEHHVSEEKAPNQFKIVPEESEATSQFIEEDDDDEGADPEILDIFLEEAEEELASITEQLANWESNLNDDNALLSLRRSYHTLKGSGRIVGAIEIGEFAWAIESLLNRIIEKTIEISPAIFTVLGQAKDVLPEFIDQIRGKGAPSSNYQLIVDNANKLEKGESILVEPLGTLGGEPGKFAEPASEQEIDEQLDRPPVYDPVLVEIFTNETNTHIASIRHYIENCHTEGLPCQVNNDLIRALHTLHGSAHMANVSDIAELSDQLEKYVKLAFENQTDITQEIITLLNKSIVSIETMIGGLSEGTINLGDKDILIAQTIALIDAELSSQKDRLGGLDDAIDATAETNIDDELIGIFLREAREILNEGKAPLSLWIQSPENMELADELRRHMHTLKGGAKISNLPFIAEVSSHVEALLTQAIDNMISVSQELVKLTEDAYKWINDYLELQVSKSPVTPTLALQKVDIANRADALSLGYGEEKTSAADPYSNEPSMEVLSDETISIEAISSEAKSSDYLETDAELVDIFVTEAQGILANTKEILEQWSEQLDNLQLLENLQRAVHMLKGGARMAKLTPIGDTAQAVEMVLTQITDATLQPSKEVVDTIYLAHDWTAHALESLVNSRNISVDDELLSQLQSHLTTTEASSYPQRGLLEDKISINLDEELSLEDISLEDVSLESHLDEAPDELEKPEEEIVLSDFDSNWNIDDSNDEHYDDDLADIFLEEASEILHKMDDLLQQWAGDPESKVLIEEVQRALHTIKGGARMANIGPIGDLSHSIETVLEKITGGHLSATPQLVEVVQSSYDWLNESLDKVRRNETLPPAKHLMDEIEISVGLKKRAEIIETKDKPLKKSFKTTLDEQSDRLSEAFAIDNLEEKEIADFDMAEFVDTTSTETQKTKQKDGQIKVSAELLDNLVNFAGEVSIYRSRVDQQLGSISYNLTEFDQTVFRVKEQLRKFEIEAEAQILFRYEGSNLGSGEEDFDPLELDRFSNMQQLSRSLVESLGDLNSIKKLLENYTRETEILLLQQSRVSSELQEGLIRTRLVPFANAIPRLRRIIRQTAKELGKQTEFKVMGAEGEMDRTVLDRVVPALEHMLRNAIDHGIEMPDVRTASGKPEAGRIMLSFKQEGARIVIRIQDDGHGMNLKAIRAKAIERDLMISDADLSDNEVMQFVLESGFSTAEKVTQISGRGVGMDVVNTEIKQVAGTLHIDSKEGKGSIFTIQLPLTVSANQALLIETGEDKFAIPLSSVDGVIRVSGKELDNLFNKDKPMYKYGGRDYGFFHLGSILGLSSPLPTDPKVKVPLILARAGDHNVALLVEQIVGRQEIVIKSVGPQISTVNGISGATIMGDGGVALILDISSLIREGMAHIAKAVVERERLEAERVASSAIPLIMVVDDSITVRKVTERLLKRHNMEPITAKDGIDALDKLQDQIPDLMLLDVEMPRMDGFELATAMRNDSRLKNIPIIMITSRTGDKHRERASKIGVDAYLGKPFQETELLENIEIILKTSE
ncbi:MAG: response regulator [Gammaproteobacteria bacterium]|nr:response regulator [Gammaproteobacteria bacterium]